MAWTHNDYRFSHILQVVKSNQGNIVGDRNPMLLSCCQHPIRHQVAAGKDGGWPLLLWQSEELLSSSLPARSVKIPFYNQSRVDG